ARKFLDFLRDAGIPVVGGIENMSGLLCPHCGETVEVFPPVAEERSIWSDGAVLLGRIPLDPALAASERFDAQADAFAAGRDPVPGAAARRAAGRRKGA